MGNTLEQHYRELRDAPPAFFVAKIKEHAHTLELMKMGSHMESDDINKMNDYIRRFSRRFTVIERNARLTFADVLMKIQGTAICILEDIRGRRREDTGLLSLHLGSTISATQNAIKKLILDAEQNTSQKENTATGTD